MNAAKKNSAMFSAMPPSSCVAPASRYTRTRASSSHSISAIVDPAYFPGGQWERRAPAAAGFDPAALDGAIRYAQQNEAPWERDVFKQIQKDVANEPYPAILGETKERGGPAGMIVRHGYLVAQWGDIDRVDMSFSVAKSYLSTVAGLAVDAGLITDVNDRVADYVQDGGFDDSRNRKVTWHMLLNQKVMDPIGASDTWVWHGYRNSYVDIGGRRVQSVSGGSHWGGGFWASTRDHARFGYLLLRRGEWNGKRILSERWVDLATQPTAIAPHYGYLWWLSRNRRGIFPGASESSFFALGSGGNMIWIAPEDDLVVVTRWLDIPKLDGFITRVSAALQAETKN